MRHKLTRKLFINFYEKYHKFWVKLYQIQLHRRNDVQGKWFIIPLEKIRGLDFIQTS